LYQGKDKGGAEHVSGRILQERLIVQRKDLLEVKDNWVKGGKKI